MTDIDKQIKFQVYIRNRLRTSTDINKTVKELIKKFKTQELYDLIIDIYCIIKSERECKLRDKEYTYENFSRKILKRNREKQLIINIINKYLEKL